MAPVLFLFLMAAFAESLEKVAEVEGWNIIELECPAEEDFANASIRGHRPKNSREFGKGVPFKMSNCLYVDDGAFAFGTRGELQAYLPKIHHHFARFGLEMHIGRTKDGKTTASKTECIFFNPPQFFDDLHFNPIPSIQEETQSSFFSDITVERAKNENEKAKTKREDRMYDDLPETQPIQVADGFVTFTKHFKYLGSYISYNLRDD